MDWAQKSMTIESDSFHLVEGTLFLRS